MLETIRRVGIVSRAEFILPNLGSLIMGLAWGASPPLGLIKGAILVILSFAVINLSSAIGAQANTLSDYELDLKDGRKRQLVQAMDSFGQERLRALLIGEFVIALVLVSFLMLIHGKPILLIMWIIGISLRVCLLCPTYEVEIEVLGGPRYAYSGLGGPSGTVCVLHFCLRDQPLLSTLTHGSGPHCVWRDNTD